MHIHKDTWIAKSADMIGDVRLGKNTSVFYQAVLRADSDTITIEEATNIQDGCILHTDKDYPIWIEKRVSVGHGCILHGCHIGKECMIGMGAIILNGVEIGDHCIIGAGSVVLENTKIESGSVVVGSPAKVIKKISDTQIDEIIENSKHYCLLAKEMKQLEEN